MFTVRTYVVGMLYFYNHLFGRTIIKLHITLGLMEENITCITNDPIKRTN